MPVPSCRGGWEGSLLSSASETQDSQIEKCPQTESDVRHEDTAGASLAVSTFSLLHSALHSLLPSIPWPQWKNCSVTSDLHVTKSPAGPWTQRTSQQSITVHLLLLSCLPLLHPPPSFYSLATPSLSSSLALPSPSKSKSTVLFLVSGQISPLCS